MKPPGSSSGTYKIYKYTFPDGKIYIGVTKNTVQYRKDCGYQHNKQLQQAIRNVGMSAIKVDILSEVEDRSAAYEEEKRMIALHNATDPDIGFNVSRGGINTFEGLRHTEEHRKKMSNLLKGRRFSEASLTKMRLSHAKERMSVVAIDADGNVVAEYESIHQAANSVGGYPTNIARACKTAGKQYKGYLWRFAKTERG